MKNDCRKLLLSHECRTENKDLTMKSASTGNDDDGDEQELHWMDGCTNYVWYYYTYVSVNINYNKWLDIQKEHHLTVTKN